MPIDRRQACGLRIGFAEWAPTYDRETLGPMRWTAPREVARLLRPFLRDGDRVLDLGCGTGQTPAQFHPLALRWTGADLSAAMLRHARARGVYESLRRMNVDRRRWPFAAAAFDAVAASGVFEFTAQLDHALREIRRILRPGGRLAFTVETPAQRGSPFEVFDSSAYHYIRYRYGASRVAALLGRGGFHAIRRREFTAYRNEDQARTRYVGFLVEKPEHA
ncbi:MAG: methyltransferase domain-containing protein [Candidatus Sumerlaeota bacterium]|nr:methyltransferase domain-containing protein [Candidatus Sumerlaeota bacterium]